MSDGRGSPLLQLLEAVFRTTRKVFRSLQIGQIFEEQETSLGRAERIDFMPALDPLQAAHHPRDQHLPLAANTIMLRCKGSMMVQRICMADGALQAIIQVGPAPFGGVILCLSPHLE